MNDLYTYKKGLMTQFPFARGREAVCKNIGDYIQAVATRQFVDRIDEYIEQEEANNYFPSDQKPIRLIMNGWFQWRSENWPPSEYIYPLLISMHISPLKAEELLNDKGIAFLKKFGPVGCRDHYTRSLLESKGIPAYFSACMTLTLGRCYSVSKEERSGVYIVDPYFRIPEITEEVNGKKKFHLLNAVKGVLTIIRHYRNAKKLSKKSFFKDYSPKGFLDRNNSAWRRLYKSALFYKTYSKKFGSDIIMNAEYITHWMDVKMDGSVTNDDLLDTAESLIKKYAGARMVITSRIHAGLPCLGVGTPVIFIANEEVVSDTGTFNTPGRLGGLIELFRVMTLTNGHFSTKDSVLEKMDKISLDQNFNNKEDWKEYAEKLAEKAESFMRD